MEIYLYFCEKYGTMVIEKGNNPDIYQKMKHHIKSNGRVIFMTKLQGNAVIGQSGGPTAAINSSLAGVYLAAKDSGVIGTVLGMVNGLEGFLSERLVDLGKYLKTEEDILLLKRTPASYLGSCRLKLPDWREDDSMYRDAFALFEKYDIRYFFYIGGNDSMDTVMKLSSYAKENGKETSFIGVPKTVDNDLLGTDHTPGFGSAAKYIAATVREIAQDARAYFLNSVSVVEIMGRNAGWLTGASALARQQDGDGPDLIYLPECEFSFERYLSDLKQVFQRKKNIVVAVSEGVRTSDGKYLCDAVASGKEDVFGHKYLGGAASVLANYAAEKLCCKTRGIELNIPQRCAGHFLSETDVEEAFQNGASAVKYALAGETGVMIAILRISDEPYRVEFSPVDVGAIANGEKTVPCEWITDGKNDVTEAFLSYVRPLILGETAPCYENGLPKHLVLPRDSF